MNRTERLFALTLALHGDHWQRAGDLSRQFQVSERTIYRDLLALGEAGVPVVGRPGAGYRLMDGYLLKALHLTAEESVALHASVALARSTFDSAYRAAADSALHKLEAVMFPEQQRAFEQLHDHLRVVTTPLSGGEDALAQLRQAILQRRALHFCYVRPEQPPEERTVYPLRLVYLHRFWLLGAFDPLLGERRSFRVSRIERLTTLSQTFDRVSLGLEDSPAPQDGQHFTARLRFPAAFRQALLERPCEYQSAWQEREHTLEIELRAYTQRDVLPWVLSWGAAAQVIEPACLHEAVLREARLLLDGHGS